MKIARIKGERLGGWIVALYDLQVKNYVGFEIFILPGKEEAVARQLASALTQFGNSGCGGIMQDLCSLCDQHDVPVNPDWTVYTLRRGAT